MTLTTPRATFGINARATPVKSGTTGTVQVGANSETVTLTAAKQVSFQAVLVGSASDLIIDISDLDNTGSTAWTAGNAQVETATVTAASGATSGNATVTVTATGMTGSPKAISVPLTTGTHTTATLIATAIAAALNADTAYAALFTATSSGASVITTGKASSTYTLNGTSVPIYTATIANLNVALAGGLGITAAATSADTAAGVATAGCIVPDLDGNDFEGEATGGLASVDAVYIKNAATSEANALITQSTVLTDYPLTPGDIFQVAGTTGLLPTSDITIEPSATGDQSCLLTITLAGA